MVFNFIFRHFEKQLFFLIITLVSFSISYANGPIRLKYHTDSSSVLLGTTVVCPCSLFQPTDAPATGVSNDGGLAITVGVKFRSSQNGYINGIRFYKPVGATGTHTGSLYATDGSLLAQAVFISETASGWQEVLFSSSVAINAGTTYVASYHSSSGDYVGTANFFSTDLVNDPLTGLADGAVNGANGLYDYSATPAFPTSTYQKGNYWVDVVFNFSALPVQLSNFTAIKKANGIQLTWSTASEQKNKGFEIQRSSDGTEWNKIGFVNGAGNSETTINYQYNDINFPQAGKYYYRLRQVDIDGNSKISKTLLVIINAPVPFALEQNHPNPFNSSTTVNFSIPVYGRVKLTLYDLIGRPVKQIMDANKEAGAYQVEIGRTGLGTGVYLYKLEIPGKSLVKKMTIL